MGYVLYPQNGDRIVTIDSVASLHAMYRGSASAQLVARIVAADAGCRISGCRRDASDRATSARHAMMENLVRAATVVRLRCATACA